MSEFAEPLLCTSTLSVRLMAANTAEILLMVGLPDLDSTRCRLLLGLSISRASASNPTVALTKSRRINLAESGSPLMNSVIASSRSACAKAGSFCTRAATVSLKSRVSAMFIFPSE